MEWYVRWVSGNLLLSAFIQFALLGTLGEVLGILSAKRHPSNRALEWLAKALVWGFLGILVKYSFTGFKGFLAALVDKGFLPQACEEITILRALSLSILTNSMFGPLLMVLHRTTDNLISRSKGYAGIEKSLATLAWFWVPAHTVTFALPYEYQIGLAALWSVALGLIMGFTKRRG
ncbi:MAG: hypothetical protein JNG85_01035 [Spirochaetaceae bacterium]|nr:hypothetical protein [Spirochaetaceae bacterium]